MRLIVKQNDSTISEFQFNEGPIYIGRHKDSQIFLGHRAVSRQHAVIFQENNKWILEDLDSANKTYLNNKPIHKSEIKTGDVLRIIYFTIEMVLEESAEAEKPIDLADTLTKTAYDLQGPLASAPSDIVIREPAKNHAPAMRLPAKRLTDFSNAVEAIAKTTTTDGLLLTMLKLSLAQFDANISWAALRNQPLGPMTCHGGQLRNGRKIEFKEILYNNKINQAVETAQYMLLPNIPIKDAEKSKTRSVLISPIMRGSGCYGAVYVNNSLDSKHYNLGDLDYMMLVTTHIAAIIEKLK